MTNHSDKTILVTGATGRQGGAVIGHLIKNGVPVRALSRSPESIQARRLAAQGIQVVKGDMADAPSLLQAMKNCYGVFSIQNYFEYGGEKEVRFGKNLADAAKKSNIAHFIYNSVSGANSGSGVPHFETKYVIENYLKSSGLPYTILRPVKFMENYYIPQVFKGILSGRLFDAIQSGKKHQMIAVNDIGAYAAATFLSPETYLNTAIDLAGDELSNEEVAATMAQVLGMPVRFKRLPLLAARLLMDKEMYLMFKWFNEKGFAVNRADVRRLFPGVKPTTLNEFLQAENWQRWNKKGSV